MFRQGDQVVERGSMSCVGSVVGGPEWHGGEAYYRVNFNGRVKNIVEEDLESFVEDQDTESLLRAGKFGDHIAFARRLTMSKLRRPLRDTVYSYKASRTDFHAYQFKPLLKFLGSDRRRLLIADEVGLGKTIEAGYVLQEERARFGIQRVLVVCPASLRTKWQNELWRRFGEEFEVLDRQGFAHKLILREGQGDRGLPRLQGIVSLQSLRSNTVIEAVEQRGAPIDLLIVDEAHHCRNNETKQHRIVRALSFMSDASLLLTATPIHLGDENLFNLLRLMLPEEFDKYEAFRERLATNQWVVEAETALRRGAVGWQKRVATLLSNLAESVHAERFVDNSLYRESLELVADGRELDRRELVDLQENLAMLNLLTPVMTRTRKRDVYPDAAKREANVLTVGLSEEELSAYNDLSEYCFRRYTAYHGDFAARFALITFQRQLASSLPAALEHYAAATADRPVSDEIEEDFGDYTGETEAEDDDSWTLLNDDEFRDLIASCRRRLGREDRKLEALVQALNRREKIVVFSYFKQSLRYLERCLKERGVRCVRIDGDVPADAHDPDNDERLRRINQFRDDPSVQVLLSSEVGSEGLDFQFCHVLFNWDLPWNPMVVEQRIGRLDRLGQRAEKILIFSFSCPGTIEELILDRLYTRIGVFERTIGILEPILGQEIRELTDRLLDARLSHEEREKLIEEKARALERRVRHEEELEAQSANLVGQDEFFTEQMERVRQLGRFVTGAELHVFVEQFLQTSFPKCALVPLDGGDGGEVGPREFQMQVTEALRDFVRVPLARNDPALVRFLERSHNGKVAVTFESERAVDKPALEFITASHPLVRSISKHYDEEPTLVHPVTAVEVVSTAVPPGNYHYLWASIEETGVRGGRSLWGVVVSCDGEFIADADAGEVLLHHMVLSGRRWLDFEAPPNEVTASLLNRAKEILLDRHASYRRDVKRRNEALVSQRLASLESSYRVKRAERQGRLDENRLRGNERAVKLFEAQLRKLETDFDERCRQIEEQKTVSVSWAIEGGGYVRVVAEAAAAGEFAA